MKNCSVYSLALLVASLFSGSALAAGRTTAQWKAGLYGRSADDQLSNSQSIGVAGIANVQREFAPGFSGRFLGGFLAETGASSALFTNEFEPRSRFLLQEASFRWQVAGPLSLTAGAIDQRHHDSKLLIDGGTFPAVLAALNTFPGRWILHLDAQAAIPTSRQLSTRGVGRDSTPSLLTQKAVVGYEDKVNGFKTLTHLTHFDFRGLTHGMAEASRFYGSSVAGIAGAARFLNSYEGLEAGTQLTVNNRGSLTPQAGVNYIQNLRGPLTNDEGLLVYGNVRVRTANFDLTPQISYYRNEADSAPGFYTSPEYGHNNRRGLGADLLLNLKKVGLEIALRARRTRLIEARTFQKDRFNYVELSVETPYANF